VIEREVKHVLTIDHLRAVDLLSRDFGKPLIEHQVDIYYQHPSRDFSSTDEALRLRNVNGRTELTYKGPKVSAITKSREEITVEVSDLDKADLLLRKLGFVPVAKIEKERYNFFDGKFVISIDSVVGLGDFIEIEGINVSEDELLEYVEKLKKTYGFFGEKVIKSYLELILLKRSEARSDTN